MKEHILLGMVAASLSGIVMGTSAWPLKRMHHFKYEHFAVVSMAILALANFLAMVPPGASTT